jgi:plasmid stabilization system protein ParE
VKIRWTHRAAGDLVAIGEHIARDKSAAARAWVERLRERAAGIAEAPLAGRVVPELGRDDVREVFLRSYRIVYRVVPGGAVVLTVFEGTASFATSIPAPKSRLA